MHAETKTFWVAIYKIVCSWQLIYVIPHIIYNNRIYLTLWELNFTCMLFVRILHDNSKYNTWNLILWYYYSVLKICRQIRKLLCRHINVSNFMNTFSGLQIITWFKQLHFLVNRPEILYDSILRSWHWNFDLRKPIWSAKTSNISHCITYSIYAVGFLISILPDRILYVVFCWDTEFGYMPHSYLKHIP
jgi:hypothetical protein